MALAGFKNAAHDHVVKIMLDIVLPCGGVAEQLLQAKANPAATDAAGAHALDMTETFNNHAAVAGWLARFPHEDLTKVNFTGNTPLSAVAIFGPYTIYFHLLD